ncbi:MAG TPA: thiamine diphosphokinase [Anaerolineales bacterium]|nr:thiamine diphosphokinase [Anaerolineales bacterium]HMZ44430.1 thiamine diphosphokinase [Anaerolineales bacterium]
MFQKRIIIFANGELPNKEKARALLREDDFIIAADGGTRHAIELGRTPNIIIGDLDSLPVNLEPSTLNIELMQFPADKNETDLELAIQHALTLNPQEIIIIGALGGRLDQTLGNIALISNLQPATCNLKLNDGLEEVFFCHDHAEVNGAAGDIVSLIPWQGEVTGILTHGLKWVLQNETLYPHKTRGISNEMTGDTATIKIKSGLLLVVHRCETVIGNW